MKLNKFDEFTVLFLVNASQMAYLEDAQKTHSMLQQFHELYRYLIKNDDTTMLGGELKALGIYIDIQTARYENRFAIKLQNDLMDNDITVRHLCLLDFIDNILNIALAGYERYFNISLKLHMNQKICMTARLESDKQIEIFELFIPEK